MAYDFEVDSGQQEALAGKLIDAAGEFNKKIIELYGVIDSMGENKDWVGKDYDLFKSSTHEYEVALTGLEKTFQLFANHFSGKMAPNTVALANDLIAIVKNLGEVSNGGASGDGDAGSTGGETNDGAKGENEEFDITQSDYYKDEYPEFGELVNHKSNGDGTFDITYHNDEYTTTLTINENDEFLWLKKDYGENNSHYYGDLDLNIDLGTFAPAFYAGKVICIIDKDDKVGYYYDDNNEIIVKQDNNGDWIEENNNNIEIDNNEIIVKQDNNGDWIEENNNYIEIDDIKYYKTNNGLYAWPHENPYGNSYYYSDGEEALVEFKLANGSNIYNINDGYYKDFSIDENGDVIPGEKIDILENNGYSTKFPEKGENTSRNGRHIYNLGSQIENNLKTEATALESYIQHLENQSFESQEIYESYKRLPYVIQFKVSDIIKYELNSRNNIIYGTNNDRFHDGLEDSLKSLQLKLNLPISQKSLDFYNKQLDNIHDLSSINDFLSSLGLPEIDLSNE